MRFSYKAAPMMRKQYCALTMILQMILRMMCYRSYKRFLIFVILFAITYTFISYIPTTRPNPSLEYGENGEVKGIKDYSRGEMKVLGIENGDIEDHQDVEDAAEAFIVEQEKKNQLIAKNPPANVDAVKRDGDRKEPEEDEDGDQEDDEDNEEPNGKRDIDKSLENDDDAPVPLFSGPLKVVPENFVSSSKCPACFGTDMCQEIQKGDVKIEIPQAPNALTKRGIYFGVFQNKGIMIKTYAGGFHFQQYEEYMCKNITGNIHCDIATDMMSSFVTKDQAFTPKQIKRAYRVAHTKPEEMLNVVCLTNAMIEQMQDAVDEGPKVAASPADNAMLYTNIVVYPEVINFRFLATLEIGWPFPDFIGSCGRMIVLDHAGRPLEAYLRASWERRADLALQLLQTIDALINSDNAWFVMYSGFTFDNFQVSNQGKLKIVDAQDVGFVDRDAAGDYEAPEDAKACNEDCFVHFFNDLYDYGHPLQETTCMKASHVAANAMYALACRDILSDLPEHKHFNDRPHKNYPGRGLLHSMPKKFRQELTDSLYDCVEEAAAGNRMTAVEEILEVLAKFGQDEPQAM